MFHRSALAFVFRFVVAMTLFTSFATSKAEAGVDSRGWAGGLMGLTVPSADNTSSRSMYGITAGAKVGSEWGVGAYYLTSQKKEDLGDFDFDLYGVQFGYHFEGEANGVFVAGRIGTSKIDVGAGNVSPMNLGAVIGYDHMLGEHLSLGGEASFMSITEDSPVDSFTLLSFMGAVKFWF